MSYTKYGFTSVALLLLAACSGPSEEQDNSRATQNFQKLQGAPVAVATRIFGDPMRVTPNPRGQVYAWSNVAKFMTRAERQSYQSTGVVPKAAFGRNPCIIKLLADSDDTILNYSLRGDYHTCEEFNVKINSYFASHPQAHWAPKLASKPDGNDSGN